MADTLGSSFPSQQVYAAIRGRWEIHAMTRGRTVTHAAINIRERVKQTPSYPPLEDLMVLVERERGGDPALVHSVEGCPDGFQMRPLAYAARLGRKDVVIYLIDVHGVQVDHRDVQGYTALHRACLCDHLVVDQDGVVQSLVQRGANPMAVNYGMTPLIMITYYGYGRSNSTRALVDACDDALHINFRDNNGSTALWYACFNHDASSVGLLLAKGADWTIPGKWLNTDSFTTPIEIARDTGFNDKIVKSIEVRRCGYFFYYLPCPPRAPGVFVSVNHRPFFLHDPKGTCPPPV